MGKSYLLAGSHRCCNQLKSTAPPLLENMLVEAELWFGARNRTFKILAATFDDADPHIWYASRCGHVALRLSALDAQSQAQHLHQLSHECIHLLSPTTRSPLTILEEGLAIVFAESFMSRFFPMFKAPRSVSQSEAAQQVRSLLFVAPDAIRTLRSVEDSFDRMNYSTFAKAGLARVSHSLQKKLLSRFEHN